MLPFSPSRAPLSGHAHSMRVYRLAFDRTQISRGRREGVSLAADPPQMACLLDAFSESLATSTAILIH